jgi:site-specific DNA-methyltransferase (cytosine-N4-specific)
VDCAVTSPPFYGLRDYGTGRWEGGDPDCDHAAAKIPSRYDYPLNQDALVHRADSTSRGPGTGTDAARYRETCTCGARRVDDQIGLEQTVEEYLAKLVAAFAQVRRVLKPSGSFWLEVGDSYSGAGAAPGRNDTHRIGGGSLHLPNPASSATSKYASGGLQAKRSGVYRRRGHKPKDLLGVPWQLALALREDGWYLRSEIIWARPNPMPESARDRPTRSHSTIFLLTKRARYYFDQDAVREDYADGWTHYGIQSQGRLGDGAGSYAVGKARASTPQTETLDGIADAPQVIPTKKPDGWDTGPGGHGTIHRDGREKGAPALVEAKPGRNVRSVWTISAKPYADAHFATFPEELVSRCIAAGCPEGGTVLDPFAGSGTTLDVARRMGRRAVGIELNRAYCELADRRLRQQSLLAEAMP